MQKVSWWKKRIHNKSIYVEQIDEQTLGNAYYITYQQQIKNYDTGAPMRCRTQENSNLALRMLKYLITSTSHTVEVPTSNVDVIIIRNGNNDFIHGAGINIQCKDEFAYVGNVTQKTELQQIGIDTHVTKKPVKQLFRQTRLECAWNANNIT